MAEAQIKSSGRAMLYPYTFIGKLRQAPWKFIWKTSKTHRMFVYSALACVPLILVVNGLLTCDANQRTWKEKRAHRLIDAFDPHHGKH